MILHQSRSFSEPRLSPGRPAEMRAEPSDRRHFDSIGEEAGRAIEGIRINSITIETRGGRPVYVKRRRATAKPVAVIANLFFRLAGNMISVWVNTEKWQRWEIDCFHLLNGDHFRAFAEAGGTVCADKLPGNNLKEILERGALTEHIMEIAARELRRVHELWCERLRGTWSHGDLQMSNIVYDEATDRARLVDFEIIHNPSLPTAARRADDILILLQDMMGRVPASQWIPLATAFIDAYGRREVTVELLKNLIVPRGVEGLWWKIRTNEFNRPRLVARVAGLREALKSRPLTVATHRRSIRRRAATTRTPTGLVS